MNVSYFKLLNEKNIMNTLFNQSKNRQTFFTSVLALLILTLGIINHASAAQTLHKTIEVQGQHIFYREAGIGHQQTIVLLHGFPTSSHMYRNLIPVLAENYHVIAPDYPGFGNSSMPALSEFEYSFDNLAKITDAFLSKVGAEEYTPWIQLISA